MNATAGLSWRGWDNSQIGWDVISLETEQMCSDEVLAQADAFSQARNTGCFKKIMQGYYTALENNTVCAFWHSFKLDNCMIDLPVEEQPYQTYWLHPDHLGSGSVITNQAGATTNWYEYMPFGEMLMEQSNYEYNNPYKYNGKELDEATGLYYYGARYYDPKASVWLSVDPLAVYNPVMETEFYGDGQHNGGVFYSGNLNPYIYTYQNPIIYIDPNGKQTRAIKEVNVYAHTIVWGADGYVRYRNPQNDQTVNRIQSNNKLMNNWSGASEDKITIFPRGQNKSYTVNSQDVDPQHRATFVNDVSKLFGAYNGDKVRAFEQFADFMDPINKGLELPLLYAGLFGYKFFILPIFKGIRKYFIITIKRKISDD